MTKLKPRNLNFLQAYEDVRKSAGKKKAGRTFAVIAPLALLAAALLTVFLLLVAGNAERVMRLAALEEQMAVLRPQYDETLALTERRSALNAELAALEAGLAASETAPTVDKALFAAVSECAGDIFTISLYRYEEQARLLSIDASAPSVNDVPDLVECLRATGLFSSVRYTGYTSDADGVYSCTVDCALLEGVPEA